MAGIPPRAINLGLQLASIKMVLPEAQGTVRGGELVCMVPHNPLLPAGATRCESPTGTDAAPA